MNIIDFSCNTGDVFEAVPRDVQISCGMKNIAHFSCIVRGIATFPNWVINSTRYSSYFLPVNHSYNGTILTVTSASKYNNSYYQCRTALNNGLLRIRCPTYYSCNATLTVDECGKLLRCIF